MAGLAFRGDMRPKGHKQRPTWQQYHGVAPSHETPVVCDATCAAWLQVRCMAVGRHVSTSAPGLPRRRTVDLHGPAVIAACGLTRCAMRTASCSSWVHERATCGHARAQEAGKGAPMSPPWQWPWCTLCGAKFHAFGLMELDALRSATFHVGPMRQPFGEDLSNGVPMPHLPYQEPR